MLSIRERGEISFSQIIAIPHSETTVLEQAKRVPGFVAKDLQPSLPTSPVQTPAIWTWNEQVRVAQSPEPHYEALGTEDGATSSGHKESLLPTCGNSVPASNYFPVSIVLG